jgi:hypothetical protein
VLAVLHVTVIFNNADAMYLGRDVYDKELEAIRNDPDTAETTRDIIEGKHIFSGSNTCDPNTTDTIFGMINHTKAEVSLLLMNPRHRASILEVLPRLTGAEWNGLLLSDCLCLYSVLADMITIDEALKLSRDQILQRIDDGAKSEGGAWPVWLQENRERIVIALDNALQDCLKYTRIYHIAELLSNNDNAGMGCDNSTPPPPGW